MNNIENVQNDLVEPMDTVMVQNDKILHDLENISGK